jgi:hypothetical protein
MLRVGYVKKRTDASWRRDCSFFARCLLTQFFWIRFRLRLGDSLVDKLFDLGAGEVRLIGVLIFG